MKCTYVPIYRPIVSTFVSTFWIYFCMSVSTFVSIVSTLYLFYMECIYFVSTGSIFVSIVSTFEPPPESCELFQCGIEYAP